MLNTNIHIFKKTAEPSMMVGWWHCVRKLAAFLVASLASLRLCPPSRPKHLALRLSIRNHCILIAHRCKRPFTAHFPFGLPSHLVPLLESSLNFFCLGIKFWIFFVCDGFCGAPAFVSILGLCIGRRTGSSD